MTRPKFVQRNESINKRRDQIIKLVLTDSKVSRTEIRRIHQCFAVTAKRARIVGVKVPLRSEWKYYPIDYLLQEHERIQVEAVKLSETVIYGFLCVTEAARRVHKLKWKL